MARAVAAMSAWMVVMGRPSARCQRVRERPSTFVRRAKTTWLPTWCRVAVSNWLQVIRRRAGTLRSLAPYTTSVGNSDFR